MTEAEAKTKLCHQTMGSARGPDYCRGSACKAWDWLPAEKEREFRQRETSHEPKQGDCMLLRRGE